MQKISQKSQNLSKISVFQKNFKIEISHHLDKRKNDITRLILKIPGSNFICKPNFYLGIKVEGTLFDIFKNNSSGCISLGGP